jgi:hypothetical protein
MRSVRKTLLLGLTALVAVALAAPAAAQAGNWKKEGKEFTTTSLQWSDDGSPLASESSVGLSGSLNVEGELGGVACSANGTMALEPGYAAAELTALTLSNCTTSGLIKMLGCSGATAVANDLPWASWAKTVNGKRVINISSVDLSYELSGNAMCENEISPLLDSVTGSLTATPDSSSSIGSLALSGNLVNGEGEWLAASGTLNASPAKTYGIIGTHTVALSGSFGWSGAGGSVTCGSVGGTLVLEPGSQGTLAGFKSTSACSVTGSLKTLGCTGATISSGAPWAASNENTKVGLTGVNFAVEFQGCAYIWNLSGTMSATPAAGEVSAIKQTVLAGTLKGDGSYAWSGTMNWNPSGVYGL